MKVTGLAAICQLQHKGHSLMPPNKEHYHSIFGTGQLYLEGVDAGEARQGYSGAS